MNHHSIGGGSGAVGNLNTGDDFYQVTGGSGRVFYRDGGNPDVLKIQFLYFAFQTFNGLGLVVFHGDDRKVRFQDVPQDIDPPENFFRSLLHQTVVAGDVGFAFCSVDNQNLAVLSPDTGSQFGFGGKSGTAQTGNSHISYMIQQGVDRNLRVIRIGGIIKFLPGTVRIAFKNDAGFGKSAGMSDGSCGYGGNGAGNRGVHRHLPIIGRRCQGLVSENMLARLYQNLGRSSRMLFQRDDQGFRNFQRNAVKTAGAAFVLVGVHSSLEGIQNAVCNVFPVAVHVGSFFSGVWPD